MQSGIQWQNTVLFCALQINTAKNLKWIRSQANESRSTDWTLQTRLDFGFASWLKLAIQFCPQKTGNDCAKLASKRHKDNLKISKLLQQFIDVEKYNGNQGPVLYKKYVLKLLREQQLVQGDEEVFIGNYKSAGCKRDRGIFRSVGSKCSDIFKERL